MQEKTARPGVRGSLQKCSNDYDSVLTIFSCSYAVYSEYLLIIDAITETTDKKYKMIADQNWTLSDDCSSLTTFLSELHYLQSEADSVCSSHTQRVQSTSSIISSYISARRRFLESNKLTTQVFDECAVQIRRSEATSPRLTAV